MTDPIADMLTRIRNASAVKKAEVVLPFSKIKYQIAEILKESGWLKDVEKIKGKFAQIRVELKYDKDGQSTILSIKRISKPGRRIYVDKNNLPVVLNNLGIAIISTSRGLMTNREAKRKSLGGEVICEIY
ncbi:MAG: 30S ribosomal protein S8 [bacterium]